MPQVASVRLRYASQDYWFDPAGNDVKRGDHVLVETSRGREIGLCTQDVEEIDIEQIAKPLKPVVRLATEEDLEKCDELARRAQDALGVFRELVEKHELDMNPSAVEFMFDEEHATFYFTSDERVDFRSLVRELASEFHLRIDMRQIGVRDEARMLGGLGHCGEELCCARLGGEFKPVSIRMAKEQDLPLNPTKISGLCGRLMCCLRYEFEAYKDFHSRAPKKNARINTPDGEGKVVDLDVPREVISIKVGDEKPVKVPLADMEPPEEGARPNAVGDEAWERATEPSVTSLDSALNLFTTELSGEDKLAQPGSVRHVHAEETSQKPSRSRRRRGGSGSTASKEEQEPQRKSRRRRSTTVKSDGTTQVEQSPKGDAKQAVQQDGEQKPSRSRRRRNRSSSKQQGQANPAAEQQVQGSKVGRNSSALRANRSNNAPSGDSAPKPQGSGQRRRRRSHKSNANGEDKAE